MSSRGEGSEPQGEITTGENHLLISKKKKKKGKRSGRRLRIKRRDDCGQERDHFAGFPKGRHALQCNNIAASVFACLFSVTSVLTTATHLMDGAQLEYQLRKKDFDLNWTVLYLVHRK